MVSGLLNKILDSLTDDTVRCFMQAIKVCVIYLDFFVIVIFLSLSISCSKLF